MLLKYFLMTVKYIDLHVPLNVKTNLNGLLLIEDTLNIKRETKIGESP